MSRKGKIMFRRILKISCVIALILTTFESSVSFANRSNPPAYSLKSASSNYFRVAEEASQKKLIHPDKEHKTINQDELKRPIKPKHTFTQSLDPELEQAHRELRIEQILRDRSR